MKQLNIPNDQKNNQDRRSEKAKKSVLELDHPVFSRMKAELFVRAKNKIPYSKWQILSLAHDWNEKFFLKTKLIIFFIATFLSFFIYREITDPYLDYREGDTAQRHFIAQSTIEFQDEITTSEKKNLAADSVLPVYNYDHGVIVKCVQNIKNAFRLIRIQFPNLTIKDSKEYRLLLKPGAEETTLYQDAKQILDRELGYSLTKEEFIAFANLQFSTKFERLLVHFLAPLEYKLIVNSLQELGQRHESGITIRHVNQPFIESHEEIYKAIANIIDIQTAKEIILKNAKEILLSNRSVDELVALSAVLQTVTPNLIFNYAETQKRIDSVVEDVAPVNIRINKGEPIVRYGDTITKKHLIVFRYLEKQRTEGSIYIRLLFTAILLTILLYTIFLITKGGYSSFQYTSKDILVYLILGVASILAIKGTQFVAIEALLEKFPQIPLEFYYYLVPVAAAPAIIQMISGRQPAVAFTVIMAVIGGILLERNFFYMSYVITSSFTAIIWSTRIKTRAVVYRMGLFTGLINIAMIACIVANTRNGASLTLLWQDSTWIVWSGLLSGLLTSVVLVAIVPILESVFGNTTDLRLLELSAMNHPLLRDLMVKAPGTYHHSVIIGSLVEKAAETIDANPLLARVMAYYHDVGKMERPQYFIENQGGGYNRHDALQPHMSAMVIREHVKKGQELGYKYKLPQPVIDAMSEHHGSSTITYFYNKARSMAENPDSVLPVDYKYDGKKPQTKESALIMLGDVVEAATRSLADPTPIRLSNVVRNVLNKYFAEGHLSECNLTLRDLDSIANSFVEVLIGIYHARIDYGISVTRDSGSKRRANAFTNTKTNTRKTQTSENVAGARVQHLSEVISSSSTSGSRNKKS